MKSFRDYITESSLTKIHFTPEKSIRAHKNPSIHTFRKLVQNSPSGAVRTLHWKDNHPITGDSREHTLAWDAGSAIHDEVLHAEGLESAKHTRGHMKDSGGRHFVASFTHDAKVAKGKPHPPQHSFIRKHFEHKSTRKDALAQEGAGHSHTSMYLHDHEREF